MKGWALLLTVLLYVWTAWDYQRDGNWQLCGAFVCYAMANVFLWFLLKR